VHLTSVNTVEGVLVSHLLDSLSVVPYLGGAVSLCDVGSGAGLPGIPLAVALPHLSVTLLESNQKKGHFLHEVVRQCGLSNVHVVIERVENYQPLHPFSAIITRAFSSLKQMLQQTTHLCDNEGRFLAMKAEVLDSERQEIPHGFLLEDKITLSVPSLTHRTLWIFKKRNEG
jgi:16S rRNA (guanine527-N7)-methyltransferase